MCVLAIALSVITQKLSVNLLLGQGLTLAWSLLIRLDCWPASSRYMTLSTSLLFFITFQLVHTFLHNFKVEKVTQLYSACTIIKSLFQIMN